MSSADLSVIIPAPLSALADGRGDAGSSLLTTAALRSALFRQADAGELTAAIFFRDELAVLCGVWAEGSLGTVWMMPGPALATCRYAAARAGRLLLADWARGFETVIAKVRNDLTGPPKLARLMGFEQTGKLGAIGPYKFEVYSWDQKRPSQIRKRKLPQKSSAIRPPNRRNPHQQIVRTRALD